MSIGLIESSQEGGATVARVSCRQIIDQSVINGIYQQVAELSGSLRDGQLIVDLADVEYMSGVTLSMFMLLDQAAAKGGNRMGFCQLTPAVDELFRVSRFHKVVNVFGTRKEAIDGLSRSGHQSRRDKNKQAARRNGQGLAARELVASEVESEASMSGILPGLGTLVDDESTQIEADRLEMFASDEPTFTESELVIVDDGDDDVDVIQDDAEETSDAELLDANLSSDDLARSSKEELPRQIEVAGSVIPEDQITLIGDPDQDDVNDASTSQSTECEADSISQTEFLESDWGRLFAAAEKSEPELEPEFVVELPSQTTTTEKPRWVVVESAPRQLPTVSPLSSLPDVDNSATSALTSQQVVISQTELGLLSKDFVKPSTQRTLVTSSQRTISVEEPIADDKAELQDDEEPKESSYDKHMTVLAVGPGDAVDFDQVRAKIVGQRHVMLSEFLRERNLAAFVLTRPSNFAWFTAGGRPTFDLGNESTATLVITPSSRTLLCRDADVPQLLGRELAGLGFALSSRPWYDDPHQHLGMVLRGREVACDQPWRLGADLSRRLAKLRLPLTVTECQSLRSSGGILSQLMELTARSMHRGDLENTVAGHLLHRLVKNDFVPVRIQVQGDGRGERNRQWNYDNLPIERHATLSVIARRKGLHVAMSRTVSFDRPSPDLRQAHLDSLLVQATAMFNSRHRSDIAESWDSIEHAFEKIGRPDDWQSADLGCVTGYEMNEAPIVPGSQFELISQMPLICRAAVGPAQCMDTILVRESIFKVLTKMEDWPQITLQVRGARIARPDILVLRG